MHNIPPCASCHGGSDLKTASPLLDGERVSYIRDQLHAFANGARKNDIHAQMRNVACGMTPEEIETVAPSRLWHAPVFLPAAPLASCMHHGFRAAARLKLAA